MHLGRLQRLVLGSWCLAHAAGIDSGLSCNSRSSCCSSEGRGPQSVHPSHRLDLSDLGFACAGKGMRES